MASICRTSADLSIRIDDSSRMTRSFSAFRFLVRFLLIYTWPLWLSDDLSNLFSCRQHSCRATSLNECRRRKDAARTSLYHPISWRRLVVFFHPAVSNPTRCLTNMKQSVSVCFLLLGRQRGAVLAIDTLPFSFPRSDRVPLAYARIYTHQHPQGTHWVRLKKLNIELPFKRKITERAQHLRNDWR